MRQEDKLTILTDIKRRLENDMYAQLSMAKINIAVADVKTAEINKKAALEIQKKIDATNKLIKEETGGIITGKKKKK